MITILLSLICMPLSYAGDQEHQQVAAVVGDVVGNLFHMSRDTHDEKLALVSNHFNYDGRETLSHLDRDTGIAMLVQDHDMVLSAEKRGQIVFEPRDAEAKRWKVAVPLLLTYNNASAVIKKPVLTSFEVVWDSKSQRYHVANIAESLDGDIQMKDKFISRAQTCPMFVKQQEQSSLTKPGA